jgi:hypothetical protein
VGRTDFALRVPNWSSTSSDLGEFVYQPSGVGGEGSGVDAAAIAGRTGRVVASVGARVNYGRCG